MRPPLSYVPLLPVTLSFIAGVIIFGIGAPTLLAGIPAIISVLLFFKGKAIVPICLMALSFGWIDMSIQSPAPLSPHLVNKELTYQGTVQSVNDTETSRHLVINIEQIDSSATLNNSFKCRLTLPSTRPAINAGDIVAFTAKLQSPQNRHDLPDEWDLKTFLYRQGIVATVYIQPDKIKVIGENDSWLWNIRRLQPQIIALLGASSLSDNSTEFLIATITGDDSLLHHETRAKFSAAGLAHILALSGLHVGLIALIIGIALYPIQALGYNRVRLAITIILLWLYAVITGMSPSVTRAVIMATVYISGLMLQRRHSSMNALCFAALLILALSPMSLYSVGFQLSFAAVISILLFTEYLNPMHRRHRIGYYLSSMMCVSIAATLGTGAISAYYFHTFPLYFLIGNILVLMILPFVIGGGVILIIFEACGYDPSWFCSIIDFLYSIIKSITDFSASLPGASIDGIYFSAWLLIPYFATIALLAAAIIYRRLAYGCAAFVTAVFSFSMFHATKPEYQQYEIFFPRNTYYTNIIARAGSEMYLFSTVYHSERDAAIERAKLQYCDYMEKRSVDSLIFVTDSFKSELITRMGRNIILGGRHYIIIDGNDDLRESPVKPDYALVCRGFKGKIEDVDSIIKADTILLSYDLHQRRHDRYLRECRAASIPHRSLRNVTSP